MIELRFGYFQLFAGCLNIEPTYIALAAFGVISGIVRLSMLKETITSPNGEDRRINFRNMAKLARDSFKEHFKTWILMPHVILALAISYMIWSFEYGLAEPYWIVYAEGEKKKKTVQTVKIGLVTQDLKPMEVSTGKGYS